MKNLIIYLLIILIILLVSVIYFLSKQTNIEIKDEAENMEIERKFLINKISDIPYDLTVADKFEIDQRYVNYDPEIRIRNVNDTNYFITFKNGKGLIRQEFETEINKEQYDNLFTKTSGNPINKTRYQFYVEKEYVAVDVFHDMFDGLIYFEVEFKSEEEANKYAKPNWVGEDVTELSEYKNGALSKYGMPNIKRAE